MRSAVAWQSWFSRRRSKFLGDVRATRARRALDASAKLDNGETSETQSQSNANDERFDNDSRECDEDTNAMVGYLLARPCKSDENPTVYWKGFRTAVSFSRPSLFPTYTKWSSIRTGNAVLPRSGYRITLATSRPSSDRRSRSELENSRLTSF